MMRIDVLTLFPEMFPGPLGSSILGRAQQEGLIEIHVHDLRDWTEDRHRTADDYPYGGGAGMVLKAEPFFRAFDELFPGWDAPRTGGPHRPEASGGRAGPKVPGAHVVYLTPQGRPLDQKTVRKLAACERLVLLCGHYEGTDERVREALVDEELSIGDYVLTGGELPAMVVIDAVARLVPGVLGRAASALEESFVEGLLEHPHYTRPAEVRGRTVPEVLLSGNHEMVRKWRRRESLRRTLERRPELLLGARLTREDLEILRELVEASGKRAAGTQGLGRGRG
jgi:tRNA (guanine37-N1)-methyltransferase